MQYDEIMKELRDMRSHFDGGFSTVEQTRIIDLYWLILHKRIANPTCGDCYRDAFIEIFTTLQRTGALPEAKHYVLAEGKYLHIFGTSDYLFEVTDEQAETFLSQCPEGIDNFAEYPQDWEERVKKRKMKSSYKRAAEARANKRKAKQEENNE